MEEKSILPLFAGSQCLIDYLTGFKVAENFPFPAFHAVLSLGLWVHFSNLIHKFETNLPCKQIMGWEAKLQTPFKYRGAGDVIFYAAVALSSNEK